MHFLDPVPVDLLPRRARAGSCPSTGRRRLAVGVLVGSYLVGSAALARLFQVPTVLSKAETRPETSVVGL